MGGPSAGALLAHRRTVRGPLADSPQFIAMAENLSVEHLVNKFYEQQTIRLLLVDSPRYQNSDSSEFCNFSPFQLQFWIIAHIKSKNIKTYMNTIQKLI
jgi:hypothetical protein